MAKTNKPPFPQDAKMGFANCTLASTWGTTPSNPVLIGTIGTNDAVLTKVNAIPLGTSTAMVLLLFANLPGKAEINLIAVKAVPAQAVSASSTTWTGFDFDMSELNTRRLPAGTKLYAGISVALAAGMLIGAEWTDY